MLDLLDETYRIEADGDTHDSTVLKVLALFSRCLLLDGELVGVLVLSHALDEFLDCSAAKAPSEEKRKEREARLSAAADRVRLVKKWRKRGRVKHWRELVQLAHHLDDGSRLANWVIVRANDELLHDPAIESDEARRLLRDSSARARMLAAMDPGSFSETLVILNLRLEGKLCNDLGRLDEATRAFARADEIIDRYPAADPDLVFS